MGVEQKTYIICPDGRIRATFAKVKPEGHAAAVAEALEAAAPASGGGPARPTR